jgi:lysophospholipase L1-like esterase
MKHKHRSGQEFSIRIFHYLFCLCFIGVYSPEGSAKTIAVLGDSISTGAVAHPSMQFNKTRLWSVLSGETSVEPDLSEYQLATGLKNESFLVPKRLWPSAMAFTSYLDWYGQHLMLSFSSVYLDTEEYGWPAILGQMLNSKDVVLAAQDGARAVHGIIQADRLLSATERVLPDRIFLFFTGNDLCSQSIHMITSGSQYGSDLRATLEHLLAHGIVPETGVDIYVLGFLSVMQLTTSETILNKQVPAYGKVLSCRELSRADQIPSSDVYEKLFTESPEARLLVNFLPEHPGAMCPTVFGVNFDRSESQAALLANRILSFRRESIAVVDRLSEGSRLPKGVRLHYISETEKLSFTAEDIANDCFHLSLGGQVKIAKLVHKAMVW